MSNKNTTTKIVVRGTAIFVTALFAAVLLPSMSSAETPVIRQGTTSSYVVLAGSTITNTGPTTISGTANSDVGLSPGTSYTGSASVTRVGAGSDQITTTAASVAQTDLVTAYNDLGIPAPTTLGAPDLAGQTLTPGTYSTAAGTFENSGTLTLDAGGDPNAVFIFQAASTVTTGVSSTMVLTNGAQACNVYWRVGSSATLGVNSTFIGRIYAVTSITANTGAKIEGQLLAQNGAVTLDTNTITNNSCVAAVAPTTSTTIVRRGGTPTSNGGDVTALPDTGPNTLVLVLGAVAVIAVGATVLRSRRLQN
jgi:hypothetical protein